MDHELSVRVAALERSLRRQRAATVGALLALGAAVLMGLGARNDVADEIKTRRLAVVDASGKERIVARVGDGDVSSIEWIDEGGHKRIDIGGNSAFSSLSFADSRNDNMVHLSHTDVGGAGLSLYSQDRQYAVLSSATKKIGALMLMTDTHDRGAGIRMSVKKLDELDAFVNNIEVTGSSGAGKVALQSTNNMPGVELYAADQFRPVASLVASEGACLRLYDAKGTIRASLGSSKSTDADGATTAHPESTLILFDENGRAKWSSLRSAK